MTDQHNNKHTTRQQIADVFADFYESLYNSAHPQQQPPQTQREIPHFTDDELNTALLQLKRGKAADTHGIRSEMQKKTLVQRSDRHFYYSTTPPSRPMHRSPTTGGKL